MIFHGCYYKLKKCFENTIVERVLTMLCKNCGANITTGMIECEFCGSRVDMMKMGNSQLQKQKQKLKAANACDLENKIASLSSNNVLYFDICEDGAEKVRRGAQRKYLDKLGYSYNEKILLMYDNAILKTGESGLTITDRGLYSSGFFLGDKEFFVPLKEIKSVKIEENSLVVNEKSINIVLVDTNDRQTLRTIVLKIVALNK